VSSPHILLLAAALVVASPSARAGERHHFQFGSYGRAQFSGDFYGGKGKPTNVVSHGVRLEEDSYAELNFAYQLNQNDADEFNVHTVFTLALFDEMFHYTGQPTSAMAIRNLYGRAENVLPGLLHFWVGSRMYRGDDIYLVDYWPMDNLNTLGGGVDVTLGYDWLFSWHAGFNRLDDDYFYQQIKVSADGQGATDLLYMDRQKLITSLKLQRQFFKLGGSDVGLKIRLYGELHALPKGGIIRDDTATYDKETWPADQGYLAGLQLGLWGFGERSFANVWFKYARGLAAYGEMAIPWGLSPDRKTLDAQEFVAATMLNWEYQRLGLMFGGYFRYFKDADPNVVDLDDGWEAIVVARPHIFITEHFHQLFEVSWQHKDPFGLSWRSGRHEEPEVWKMAVMPAISMGRGTYSRPQFRLVFAASHLNDAARNLYPRDDARADQSWQLFAGVQVEWWYYSSYR
jgi:maltoporin